MPRKVIVTGATGLLGRQVVAAFGAAGWEVTGTGFSRASPPTILKVDIQNEDEVTRLLDEVKPTAIIHCAADRQPDSCTKNPDAARKLNVTATAHIARLASSRGIFLLYISTDYVFPGVPGQAPYQAHDTPKPTNIYGQTKLDGEEAVLGLMKHHPGLGAVLRVPVLYGLVEPEGNNKESAVNVLMDVLWKSQDQASKINIDDYAIRYPTNTADVARVCQDIAALYTSSSVDPAASRPQILQFSSEDRMTKYEICQKFAELMGLPLDGMVADRESGKKPAPDGTMRPYDCHLDTAELKALGINVNTIDFVAWWRRSVGAYRK